MYRSIFLILCVLIPFVFSACVVPEEYRKKYYSIDGGKKANLYLTKDNKLQFRIEGTQSEEVAWPKELEMKMQLEGECHEIVAKDTKRDRSVKDLLVVFKDTTKNCFFCFHLYYRSPNVVEYRKTQCNNLNPYDGKKLCKLTDGTTMVTAFVNEDTYKPFNCKSIIEGVYQYVYELKDATGECRNRKSVIKSCQAAGTELRDNIMLEKRQGWCEGLNLRGQTKFSKGTTDEKWKCYGVWTTPVGHIKAALRLDTHDDMFRFRCMLTTIDQKISNNARRWGMTITSDCSRLVNDFSDADYRMKLTPSLDFKTQVPFLKPSCNLPKEYIGNWFFPGEYNTDVTINSTHMRYRRMVNQFEYQDIIYSCRQAQENRYLMATVAVGRCEMNFICFNFVPRHHNIIRFRTSRPFTYDSKKQGDQNYMVELFREACHWNSFTLNNRHWSYQYFILNPPVPVNCPIQGRFTFKQSGDKSEKYTTKIPGGVTLRPRVKVDCDGLRNNAFTESDLAICTSNLKMMQLDVKRCMVLDHTGRPTSEYDIRDNSISCVGFWMEDTKSILITYDPDDPVSKNFRCWVYRRLSYHTYAMSRSAGSFCRAEQTALSNSSEQGVSLHLELHNNEREFDGCPMSFDDGNDPFNKSGSFYVYARAPSSTEPSMPLFVAVAFFFLICAFSKCEFSS